MQLATTSGSTVDVDRAIVALATLPGTSHSRAGRHEAGSFGGGDATWDVIASSNPRDLFPVGGPLEVMEAVALQRLNHRILAPDGPVTKRTLLLQVRAMAPREAVDQLETELCVMPEHIDAIRSWCLSRVDQATTPSRWTHVWEQEFASPSGLLRDYFKHPYHWAWIDRWFDAEQPEAIVERDVAHVYYTSDEPVLLDLD